MCMYDWHFHIACNIHCRIRTRDYESVTSVTVSETVSPPQFTIITNITKYHVVPFIYRIFYCAGTEERVATR